MSCLDNCVPEKWKREDSFWNHEAGPKTVFFWAPLVKWGLVAAGLKDILREAHSISVWQSLALALTGWIWSRYCLVIKPKNWFLFAANFFVGLTQTLQFCRAVYAQYFVAQEEIEVEAALGNGTMSILLDNLMETTLNPAFNEI